MNVNDILKSGVSAGYNVDIAREFGINEAIVLNKLVYLHQIAKRGDGFTWYTAKDWKEHTGLSYYQVNKALQHLVNAGIVEVKNTYIQGTTTKAKHHRFAVQETSKSGIQETSKSGIQETSKSGIQETSKSGIQETSKSGIQETSKSGIQETSKSGIQETSKSGIQETSKSGIQETSKSGIQETSKSVNNNAKNIVSNSEVSKKLLDLLNEKTKRNFRILPRGYKETLKKFSLEEIGKALDVLVEDDWHSKKINELKSDYLLRASTIDNMLSKRKKQHEGMADLDELMGDGSWMA